MSNLFYQGIEIAMSSGNLNGVFAKIDRVQDIKVDYQIPRVQTRVLGRFKPLNDQPVINYTPAALSINYTMGNKDVPRNLGILNSTGIATLIGNGTQVIDWGCRSFQLYNSPVNSTQYAGEWDATSGVLKAFTLAGAVSEAVKGAFSVECLDFQQVANNTSKNVPVYSGQLVKSENIIITGIDFTGLGFSGLIIQSFNFQTSFNYASTFRMGTKYPERRMTDGVATLQISAFMEGTTNTVTGLSQYDCGTFITGQYVLSLQPSCVPEPPLTITLLNPYLDSQSLGSQVGNYVSVDLSFSIPLTVVAVEATGVGMGSNVTLT